MTVNRNYLEGQHSIVITASDGKSSVTCSTTVTIFDSVPPQIHCPDSIVQATDPGQCSATISFDATATDNCGPATVVCDPPSGSVFPKGPTIVTCVAKDGSENL